MLKNKKREFLYAFSSFGPDFMFAMIIAYFLSSVNPSMFGESAHVYAWRSHAIVSTASFGVLFFISRVVDALIDIPYAARLDKIKCKYARLRLPVLISIIPLTAATIALCLPVSFSQGSIANTIYFFVSLVVFFAAYTLYMIAYRSGVTSFSRDRKQRIRVSYFKSFLDTVRFAMVYPLTMLVLSLIADTSLNVMHITLMSTPLLLTMLIPLFLTKSKKGDESAQAALLESNSENSIEKSGETATVFACEESAAAEQADTSLAASVQEAKDQSALTTAAIQPVQKQKIGILSSLKLVITTKAFWPWMIVAFLYFMGLQLFLSTQNELISGVLWLTPAYAALLNSAAFGPVPIMLFLFNKVMKKKGIRFALQVGL
ncbi:MAG: MFS transporter, partial [Firmicutes bacterium]|nr:MFS transporter [Bacillota bacterium]